MKINELRINNYYELKGSVLGGGVCQLKNLIDFIHIGNLIESDLVKPIPLTEEWLLKKKKKKGILRILKTDLHLQWCSHEKGLYLSTDIGDGSITDPDTHIEGNFKHVHQLQNLYFALTNEELTIKQ